MSWQIQEGVNVGHTDSLWTVSNFCDVIARTNFSLLQHAKVESWSVMFYEQGWHTRFIHANADAVTRHARLRYFKFSATDAVAIADAHLVIRKSLDGEVFSELAESKIVAAQKALPVMVRIHLVDEYGAVLPAVTCEIGLRITIDIEFAHHSPSIDWRFPD
jgi:glutamine synthetase adenylyltransferase